MPRVALSVEQKKKHKVKDFKGWVQMQMKLNCKTQADVGRVLGLSQPRISEMLAIPVKGKKVEEDPFSYGQVLLLCDFFEVDGDEKERLLTL